MVNYICPRCNYTTKRKTNFRYHLNRKNICKPILCSISILEIANKYNIVILSENNKNIPKNIPKTFQKHSKKHSKNIPKTFQKTNNICKFCKKVFSSYNNKWKHENRVCKIKKQLDLENENKKMNTTINNINKGTINKGTINKGTINNITINQFFDTENENIFDRLNNKKILKYLNDKFPEDKNIKCTNLQSKLCDVFVDDSFKKMHKKKAYEHLTDKMAFLIQELGNENKEKIKIKGHKNLNLTYNTLDNPEQHYDNINLELYNNTKKLDFYV
jgi:hypothetical protein